MKRRQEKSLLKNLNRVLLTLVFFSVALVPILALTFDAKHVIGGTALVPAESLPEMQLRTQDKSNKQVKPFQEPIISVTFDDGWGSVYTVAAPLMQQYGIRSTQYILSDTKNLRGYMTPNEIRSLHDAGHEIACHGVTHRDLTKLDDANLQQELTDCKATLEKQYGYRIKSFASPYSSINAATLLKTKQTYESHRNTAGDITNGLELPDINVAENYDPNNIISFAIRSDTTIEQIQKAVEYTIKNNGWLVLTYHQVEEEGAFALDKQKLDEQFKYLNSQNVRIMTMSDVVDAVKAQAEGRY